jgi:hypothetical protein
MKTLSYAPRWFASRTIPKTRQESTLRLTRRHGRISGMALQNSAANQNVTVKHIHQQVNVTEGGQAVVAGDTVTKGQGALRDVAPALNGRASLARVRPCRTGAANFMVARARGRARRRA